MTGDRDRDALLARRLRVPAHVVFRTFATETIALNLDAGTFHGLNPTAGRMVEVAAEKVTLAAAARALAAEYDRPERLVADDLLTLVGDLVQRGLVEAT